ncbi:unnamed protein product [Spodoptera exigua]|nr:unnamed protein product [Spodoptera exigua]
MEKPTSKGDTSSEYSESSEENVYTKETKNDGDVLDPDYRYTRKSGRKDENSSSNDDSSDAELEKNPGNPFTIHKNKYKQNWLYNHYMDGDHMNINPIAPKFANLGPSGPELFFGRKWWYYNQDKPVARVIKDYYKIEQANKNKALIDTEIAKEREVPYISAPNFDQEDKTGQMPLLPAGKISNDDPNLINMLDYARPTRTYMLDSLPQQQEPQQQQLWNSQNPTFLTFDELVDDLNHKDNNNYKDNKADMSPRAQEELSTIRPRRLYDYAGMRLPIIGSPTIPSQLPEAEAILPGHTLIRPALGMLKSAVKFPHKDLNDGAGVYGNIDNLGITYGGTGERVLYTGFRRNNDYSQSYVHVNLDKLVFGSLRQQHKQSSIEDDEDSLKAIPFDDPPITSDDDDLNLDKTNASSKQTWFLNTKDLYDHIKISQDAPDLKDFIPKPVVNGSGWWYYNQVIF